MTKQEIINRRKEMAELTQQGWTVTKIAEKYGISKQAVSQLLQKSARDGNTVVLVRYKKTSAPKPNYIYADTPLNVNVCVVCSKQFKSKSKNKKTCSKTCTGLLLHKSILISKGLNGDWSRYDKVKLKCNLCEKEFERTKYQNSMAKRVAKATKHDYCSRACFHASTRSDLSHTIQSYKPKTWPSP